MLLVDGKNSLKMALGLFCSLLGTFKFCLHLNTCLLLLFTNPRFTAYHNLLVIYVTKNQSRKNNRTTSVESMQTRKEGLSKQATAAQFKWEYKPILREEQYGPPFFSLCLYFTSFNVPEPSRCRLAWETYSTETLNKK